MGARAGASREAAASRTAAGGRSVSTVDAAGNERGWRRATVAESGSRTDGRRDGRVAMAQVCQERRPYGPNQPEVLKLASSSARRASRACAEANRSTRSLPSGSVTDNSNVPSGSSRVSHRTNWPPCSKKDTTTRILFLLIGSGSRKVVGSGSGGTCGTRVGVGSRLETLAARPW
jgi:hypothetical protein